MYKDVICDNNNKGERSCLGTGFMYATEAKLVLIQTIWL